ncbi:MAG: BatD family protein [Gammaproteobacteria bacterium]
MVKRFQIISTLLCIICVGFAGSAQAANITAKLSRNPVLLDESFHLIYEADSNVDDPDFSVLTQNFDILNSSQSTNMRSINGNWSLKKSWDLALISKAAGIFTIPPIPFGNDMSPSLRITVKHSNPQNAPQKPGDPGANIYIEVETDVKQAWVQSQIVYTIRLFSNIPVGRPTLSEPETDNPDTIFFKLGDVNNYEAFRNGERFAVSELKFAAFAQHSGELTFKPVLFEGLVSSGKPRSLFDSLTQRGTVKRLRSKPVSVKIKPIPPQQDASKWLPANQITLVEEWSDDITALRAGEPVTRTITLIAKGLTAEQLPELKFADIKGLKQYPDQAAQENENTSEGVTGTRTMKVALIPGARGEYRLPALNIPWWNTQTGKAEMATLPQTVLRVSGVANILSNPPPQVPAPVTTPAPNQPAAATSVVAADTHADYWRWLSIALGIGWLLTILLLRKRAGSPRPADKTASLAALARAVQKHSKASQPSEARQALLDWAKAKWPLAHIANLADVAQHCDAELGAAIRALNSALYSATPGHWQGEALASAFSRFRDAPDTSVNTPGSTLEPLYK